MLIFNRFGMASANYKIDVNAPPESVFDLISKVEGFKNYSKLIRDIKEVSPGRFLWRVEYLGVSFEWVSEVTVSERPRRFAWKSVSGTYNVGSYTLEPANGGTKVVFEMEFHIQPRHVNTFARPVLSLVMTMVAKELLDSVKRELDA